MEKSLLVAKNGAHVFSLCNQNYISIVSILIDNVVKRMMVGKGRCSCRILFLTLFPFF